MFIHLTNNILYIPSHTARFLAEYLWLGYDNTLQNVYGTYTFYYVFKFELILRNFKFIMLLLKPNYIKDWNIFQTRKIIYIKINKTVLTGDFPEYSELWSKCSNLINVSNG